MVHVGAKCDAVHPAIICWSIVFALTAVAFFAMSLSVPFHEKPFNRVMLHQDIPGRPFRSAPNIFGEGTAREDVQRNAAILPRDGVVHSVTRVRSN